MEEVSNGIKILKVLKQIRDIMKQNMKYQFNKIDITGPQGMLMSMLAHHGKMKISDLSENLGLSNSTVSGIIDRLERQGLVERIRSIEDRRVVYVSVTSEFKKNAKEQLNEIEKKFEDMMNKATPEELNTIFEGLNTLKEVMDRNK
ncbi:MarR family transcriptional regulator [Aceticella autotrophica]|uniref:MarR family transcriptional regulator n=1 Tax=Aceticella autotrophica TaxID=2755338 RepID=A0A975AWX3_9THEO|nr:MarR family transcriptional regulator [Aceticella autotrophica]QSZ27883.1 MarR family transcriptional regulator [Aceticella autotrophica]